MAMIILMWSLLKKRKHFHRVENQVSIVSRKSLSCHPLSHGSTVKEHQEEWFLLSTPVSKKRECCIDPRVIVCTKETRPMTLSWSRSLTLMCNLTVWEHLEQRNPPSLSDSCVTIRNQEADDPVDHTISRSFTECTCVTFTATKNNNTDYSIRNQT